MDIFMFILVLLLSLTVLIVRAYKEASHRQGKLALSFTFTLIFSSAAIIYATKAFWAYVTLVGFEMIYLLVGILLFLALLFMTLAIFVSFAQYKKEFYKLGRRELKGVSEDGMLNGMATGMIAGSFGGTIGALVFGLNGALIIGLIYGLLAMLIDGWQGEFE
jgi:hypothetical protein